MGHACLNPELPCFKCRGVFELPGTQDESLMDGDALDVISGVCWGHIDHVELRAVR
jgi:hypothetical protein